MYHGILTHFVVPHLVVLWSLVSVLSWSGFGVNTDHRAREFTLNGRLVHGIYIHTLTGTKDSLA